MSPEREAGSLVAGAAVDHRRVGDVDGAHGGDRDSARDGAAVASIGVSSLLAMAVWVRRATTHEPRPVIRQMSASNPRWGAERIRGELLTIGIRVSASANARSRST